MQNELKNKKILVICESPNKVKTISNILKNAGYAKTVVMASVGHIVNIADNPRSYKNTGIHPNKNFKIDYKITENKKEVVNKLKAQVANSDIIYISSDPDREGAQIGWSLVKFLDIPENKCRRMTMHEITPKAVINAFENPIPFETTLVEAAQARAATDKLIGYSLSGLAKRYIGAKSIGRCQSVGLKLVSDRENEISNFIPEVYFNLYLNFTKNETSFKAKYSGYKTESINKFTKQADVDAVISNCKDSPYYIEAIQKIDHQESPKAPFCTATFQQEAANKLGLRVKDAMSCAQKLFEGIKVKGEHVGLITYTRTDSTELAPEFIPELKSFITNTYGAEKYVGLRKAKRKSTDQDGHEALRIVDPTMTPEKLATHINNSLIIKVYKLIWQRTIAAAMPNAVISETLYTINNNGHKFILSSKELLKAGYKTVYEIEANQTFGSQQAFVSGERLEKPELETVKKFTQPPARYTEASLVKELQQKEIGRPSTYASIVETILSPTRGYAKLEEKHIVPTDRGMQLAAYCDRAFPTLINLNYTKEMEISLDKIAEGKMLWLDYMENFYKNLKEIIDSTNETGIATEMPSKTCPICGQTLIVRRSRFGKLFYGCDYPRCGYTESFR